MQGVAWTARLVRVVTYIRTALLAEQRLDGGVFAWIERRPNFPFSH
jgi:hypothetical protein